MYTNEKDGGRNGRNFECDFRLLITEKAEACHRQGVADIVVKMGVTLECKTAQPQLTAPIYNSKEEAENAIANGFKMTKAMFIAYLPTYDGTNAEDAIIVTQKAFIEIFRRHGKIRAKKHSNGKWCIAIQQYIPTPTFKASQKTYNAIMNDLFDNGEYYDTFMERMGLI